MIETKYRDQLIQLLTDQLTDTENTKLTIESLTNKLLRILQHHSMGWI